MSLQAISPARPASVPPLAPCPVALTHADAEGRRSILRLFPTGFHWEPDPINPAGAAVIHIDGVTPDGRAASVAWRDCVCFRFDTFSDPGA